MGKYCSADPDRFEADDVLMSIYGSLKDCEYLLVSRIGYLPEKVLSRIGIKTVMMYERIEEGIRRVGFLGANMLTSEELERYQRQLIVDGFGIDAQERLKGSTALVAGIGGLGGTAASYLAAAGIGRLILIHEGRLDAPDLNRQMLMTSDWVGRSRVVKAKESINKLNPLVEIEVFDEPVRMERLRGLLSAADIVLDCRHNFPERRLINTACAEAGTALVEAAMNGMEGYLFNIVPDKTACLSCLYPEDPEWDPYGFPVLGAVSGALGCLASIEAMKILTGFREPLMNAILHFDLGRMEFNRFKTYKRRDCKICGRLYLQDTRASARPRARSLGEYISL